MGDVGYQPASRLRPDSMSHVVELPVHSCLLPVSRRCALNEALGPARDVPERRITRSGTSWPQLSTLGTAWRMSAFQTPARGQRLLCVPAVVGHAHRLHRV